MAALQVNGAQQAVRDVFEKHHQNARFGHQFELGPLARHHSEFADWLAQAPGIFLQVDGFHLRDGRRQQDDFTRRPRIFESARKSSGIWNCLVHSAEVRRRVHAMRLLRAQNQRTNQKSRRQSPHGRST